MVRINLFRQNLCSNELVNVLSDKVLLLRSLLSFTELRNKFSPEPGKSNNTLYCSDAILPSDVILVSKQCW